MKIFNVNNGEYDYLIAAETEGEAQKYYLDMVSPLDHLNVTEILAELWNYINVADYEAGDGEQVIMRTVAEMVEGLTEPELLASNEPRIT